MTSLRQILCTSAAPALLLAVCASQVYHVRRNALNPWRGAGFAMFSTVDSPDQRLLRAYLLAKGREFPLAVPRELARLNAEARILPTRDRLSALAEALLSTARDSLAGRSGSGLSMAKLGVRVEVWRSTFDRSGSELRPAKLREVTVEP